MALNIISSRWCVRRIGCVNKCSEPGQNLLVIKCVVPALSEYNHNLRVGSVGLRMTLLLHAAVTGRTVRNVIFAACVADIACL